MSNANSRGTTILNPTMYDMNQRTPIEDLLSESDEEEDDPFNFMSTFVFNGRKNTFVSQMINDMVPMNKSV